MKTFFAASALLLFCLLGLHPSLPAQTRIGLTIGYNTATFANSKESYGLHVGNIHALQCGFSTEIPLNKTIFIQANLLLTTKGGHVETNAYLDAGYTSDYRVTYLQLPVNIGAKWPIGKKMNAFIAGGPYLARGLYGSQKGWYETIAGTFPLNNTIWFVNDNDYVTNKVNIRPFDAGYQFFTGAGWENLQLKLLYAHGLVNDFPSENPSAFRYSMFSISIDYLINLKKGKH